MTGGDGDAGDAGVRGDTTLALEAIAATGVAHRVVRTAAAESAEGSALLQGIPLEALLRTIVVRRGADDYVFVLIPRAGSSTGRS